MLADDLELHELGLQISDLDEIRSDLQVVDSELRVTHRESLLGIHEAWVVEDQPKQMKTNETFLDCV